MYARESSPKVGDWVQFIGRKTEKEVVVGRALRDSNSNWYGCPLDTEETADSSARCGMTSRK
jgi:hypothetical protein